MSSSIIIIYSVISYRCKCLRHSLYPSTAEGKAVGIEDFSLQQCGMLYGNWDWAATVFRFNAKILFYGWIDNNAIAQNGI